MKSIHHTQTAESQVDHIKQGLGICGLNRDPWIKKTIAK